MRGIDRWIHDLNKNDLAHLGEALEIAENDGQKALEQAREEHAAAVASALLRQKTELEGTAQQRGKLFSVLQVVLSAQLVYLAERD